MFVVFLSIEAAFPVFKGTYKTFSPLVCYHKKHEDADFLIFELKLVHLSSTIGQSYLKTNTHHWCQSREMPRDKAFWRQALEVASEDGSGAKAGNHYLGNVLAPSARIVIYACKETFCRKARESLVRKLAFWRQARESLVRKGSGAKRGKCMVIDEAFWRQAREITCKETFWRKAREIACLKAFALVLIG